MRPRVGPEHRDDRGDREHRASLDVALPLPTRSTPSMRSRSAKRRPRPSTVKHEPARSRFRWPRRSRSSSSRAASRETRALLRGPRRRPLPEGMTTPANVPAEPPAAPVQATTRSPPRPRSRRGARPARVQARGPRRPSLRRRSPRIESTRRLRPDAEALSASGSRRLSATPRARFRNSGNGARDRPRT